MLRRWPGATAAVLITLVTIGLVAIDLTDAAARRWWADRAFATDVVAGILVLLITVLVVDQVVRVRQLRNKASGENSKASDSWLEDSFQRLRCASAPLLEVLTAEQRSAAGGGESRSSGGASQTSQTLTDL